MTGGGVRTGAAALLVILAAQGCSAPEPPRGDVILVVLDTFRADRLGASGYPRDTTPHLDRLAAEGERFTEAWAQSSWTLPTFATILSGQPPHVHGAGMIDGRLTAVRDGIPLLAERLRDAGYATGAVVNVGFCHPSSGLARGFERYDFHGTDASNRGHRNASATTDAALSWIAAAGEAPAFLLVHYFDAHLTYDPPAPFDTMYEPDGRSAIPTGFGSAAQLQHLRGGKLELEARQKISLMARYDGEIRYLDEQFGRLRDGLERLGRWDRALVLVVGDHGEEFWDHGGFEHGHSHFAELLRIPLIVRRPGHPPAVRGERVRQLEIVPTVLEFAGLPPDEALPGGVLGRFDAPHAVADGSLWAGRLLSIRSDRGALVLGPGGDVLHAFGPDDSREREDLAGADLEASEELAGELRKLPRVDAGAAWSPDAATRRRLRALGYLE